MQAQKAVMPMRAAGLCFRQLEHTFSWSSFGGGYCSLDAGAVMFTRLAWVCLVVAAPALVFAEELPVVPEIIRNLEGDGKGLLTVLDDGTVVVALNLTTGEAATKRVIALTPEWAEDTLFLGLGPWYGVFHVEHDVQNKAAIVSSPELGRLLYFTVAYEVPPEARDALFADGVPIIYGWQIQGMSFTDDELAEYLAAEYGAFFDDGTEYAWCDAVAPLYSIDAQLCGNCQAGGPGAKSCAIAGASVSCQCQYYACCKVKEGVPRATCCDPHHQEGPSEE